ncbi:hypothetical protein [Acidipila sp. EB88]|uniref:hypothetical protein n=1 Tax=Acidipila sp. EB88 TaxID=2305226 RepID=UPI000F5DF071|nr:hypothetical protein [Acidipila sp. EB88]
MRVRLQQRNRLYAPAGIARRAIAQVGPVRIRLGTGRVRLRMPMQRGAIRVRRRRRAARMRTVQRRPIRVIAAALYRA